MAARTSEKILKPAANGMKNNSLSRLIISFSGKCALNCQYCYAPFNGKRPSDEILLDILNFAKAENINIITFGGGDPFQYSGFRKILPLSKKLGFHVHVDTHGIGFQSSDFELIKASVDLIGLPMEGPKEIHDTMRERAEF
ncbi:MAG: radical SAM protein, partial [Proteobacteria bacterium]